MQSDSESKLVFGRFNSCASLAFMISAPIGSMIASYYGLRYAVLMMAVPFVISLFIALTLKEPECARVKERQGYFRQVYLGIEYFKKHRILQMT